MRFHYHRSFFQRLIVETVRDAGSHDVAHLGCRSIEPFGHKANRDVAIGYHPFEPVTVANRQRSDIELSHLRGGFPGGRIHVNNFRALGHNFSDLHDSTSEISIIWLSSMMISDFRPLGSDLFSFSI